MPTSARSPISRIAPWRACPWAAWRPRQITLENLDKFSHIGLFSGGSISPADVNNTPGFKEKVKLVFVSYGSRELDNRRGGGRGGFGGDPKANAEALKQAGINSVFYVSPNTAHEWQSWRRSLHEFAPLLFTEDSSARRGGQPTLHAVTPPHQALVEAVDEADSADRSSWVRTTSPPSTIRPPGSEPSVTISLTAS